jgi:hypothetical protein
MAITKADLERARQFLDDDAKAAFLDMPREEQLAILLSMEGSNSNRLAVVERWQINFERDNRIYRAQREQRENGDDDVLNITQKILKAIEEVDSKKFNFFVWFRDRVLPTVMTAITLGILYLIFGGKLPTP